MSNPANKADTQHQDREDREPTFADLVNDAVSKMTKNDKGVWELPEEIDDEAVRFAAMSEKRYRDTQSGFTKVSQENKALKAEKSVLRKKATGDVKLELTAEQAEELEDLKFSDPEAWRKRMNTLENEARAKQEQELEDEVKKVSTSTLETEELERRKGVLSEFLADHEGFELNDDIIANDIPPRITKKLENGTITFEEFLQESYEHLNKGKVIADEEAPNMPNLSKVGGGDRPDKNAMKEDAVRSYSKEVY